MIEVDGYKAFRGTMQITPRNKTIPQFEAKGEWTFKPVDGGYWYVRPSTPRGSSFCAAMCEIVEDETA